MKESFSTLLSESAMSSSLIDAYFEKLPEKAQLHARKYKFNGEFYIPPSRPSNWAAGYMSYAHFLKTFSDLWDAGKISVIVGVRNGWPIKVLVTTPVFEVVPVKPVKRPAKRMSEQRQKKMLEKLK